MKKLYFQTIFIGIYEAIIIVSYIWSIKTSPFSDQYGSVLYFLFILLFIIAPLFPLFERFQKYTNIRNKHLSIVPETLRSTFEGIFDLPHSIELKRSPKILLLLMLPFLVLLLPILVLTNVISGFTGFDKWLITFDLILPQQIQVSNDKVSKKIGIKRWQVIDFHQLDGIWIEKHQLMGSQLVHCVRRDTIMVFSLEHKTWGNRTSPADEAYEEQLQRAVARIYAAATQRNAAI